MTSMTQKYALDAKKIDVQRVEKSLKTAELELKRLLSLELDDKDLKVDEKLTLAKWKDVNLEKSYLKTLLKKT